MDICIIKSSGLKILGAYFTRWISLYGKQINLTVCKNQTMLMCAHTHMKQIIKYWDRRGLIQPSFYRLDCIQLHF